ncbi:peptidase M1 [Neptunitalea chrysea]|uniref:Peptidase M1 n=2 Tax=Neptunitalea chrysea TaxID=1647581 RepID=A0A9W6EVH9_9FLAO|nr:peptidase M1 [Neptunitalea chrysea]
MEIKMDVENYQYKGEQTLVYSNNSPDALDKVFYHLYFNAFQPGSEMDIRLQNIADPDSRMVNNLGTKDNPIYESRISKLTPEEIGYIKIKSLKQDGTNVTYKVTGTILEVTLAEPILPGAKATFKMKFDGQVPVQIRRSGRNNADGVALSMTQWYPKMAEYDFEGWHADPYIAREFHGVWGNFDVKITIDKDYILGGTGNLQNGDKIGYGYETPGTKVKRRGKTNTWHFVANQVHDFTWAADPEYIHNSLKTKNGITMHFLFKDDKKVKAAWTQIQPKAAELMEYYSTHIGPYPWDQYSIIQGGDGGMEYAQCTLITGGEDYNDLFGTTAHEMAHTWFQHILATNESEHPWMDEGFTSFISALASAYVKGNKNAKPFGSYRSYYYLVNSGKAQTAATHGDRYEYNFAYSINAYVKGKIFLSQLEYVIGEEKLMETLKKYYDDFKFKHPTPNDFIRTAEKVSGAQLHWYLTDWIETNNTIDYGIKEVKASEDTTSTVVTLERIGLMPMPIDVVVEYTDGTSEYFYIPLRMMRAGKANPYDFKKTELADWPWAFPTYDVTINKPMAEIKTITIDPSGLMADIKLANNKYPAQ